MMIHPARIFPAKLSVFSNIKKYLEDFCKAAKLSGADRHRLTLVTEELFTNTVNHGHGGDSDAPVEISLQVQPTVVTLVYVDTAPRYDSLAAALRTDIESTINQYRVGGLGMALTFAIAESAHYVFADGKNRIVISLARRKN